MGDDLLEVAERGGGVAVPGVQSGQGDLGEPGDQAAAHGGGECGRPLQMLRGLAGVGDRGDFAHGPGGQRQRGGST